MCPLSSGSSRLMQRRRVLLPLPLAPMTTSTSPASTVRSMPSSTRLSPKLFRTSEQRTIESVAVSAAAVLTNAPDPPFRGSKSERRSKSSGCAGEEGEQRQRGDRRAEPDQSEPFAAADVRDRYEEDQCRDDGSADDERDRPQAALQPDPARGGHERRL